LFTRRLAVLLQVLISLFLAQYLTEFALHLLLTARVTSSIVKLDDSLGPDSSMDPQAAGDGVDIEMETDSKADFSAESSDNLPVKQNRVMKKAQRVSKNGGTAEEAVAANGVQQSGGGQDGVSKHSVNIAHKSHRRRRHARGRVQLKKGTCNYLIKNRGHYKRCRAAQSHRAGVNGLAPPTHGDNRRRRVSQ